VDGVLVIGETRTKNITKGNWKNRAVDRGYRETNHKFNSTSFSWGRDDFGEDMKCVGGIVSADFCRR
jgi:hypothetical protein